MSVNQQLIVFAAQAIKDHILATAELHVLRVQGPILAGDQLFPIVKQYARLFQLNKEEQRELYCACVTAEFWNNIPAE